jgi:rhodanese-related sulfurtransferase
LYFIDSTVKEVIKEERIEMPININRDNVWRLIANGAQLVEVLPAEEYNEAHLPGAMNIPLKKLNKQSIKPLDPSRPVIVYCNDFQ